MAKTAPIIIYPSKKKTLTLCLAGILFVFFGVLFAVYQKEMKFSDVVVVIVSYIGVPFFGFGTICAFYRLIAPKPALTINEAGIFDNSGASSVGMLRWEEIAELVPYEVMGVKILGIVPKNPEAVIARQKPIKQMVLRANQKSGMPLIGISESILPMTIEQLLAKIQPYLKK